jgi:enamine deaminase RidA (YjgF/YER057c/UK114 family)
VDADGNSQHPGDMAAQLEMSLDNLGAVLAAADMTLANVVRLNVYTTDFDEFVKHWATIAGRFRNFNGRFATTLLGVSRLFTPQLLVLLEATAVDCSQTTPSSRPRGAARGVLRWPQWPPLCVEKVVNSRSF